MTTAYRRKPESDKAAMQWVPDRGAADHQGRYMGPRVKPWEYSCEVWIPVLDTPETLYWVIGLLRSQTARPYIVLVDTGSTAENLAKIERFRADDVEIHSLRFGSVRHPSDFPAIACDLAMSSCRSDYLFFTHADCMIRRRDFLADMLDLCGPDSPAVGYQMSPRGHDDWEKMVSHTATMLHMPTMDRIGAGFSLRRLCNIQGIEHAPNSWAENWPDTECLLNYLLWQNGLTGTLIGQEPNFLPTKDENIFHFRSLTAARLYAPVYAEKCEVWMNEAIEEAQYHLNLWSGENS